MMRTLPPSELVERALAVPGTNVTGRVVLVTEYHEAVLRWANNTMTTNGHSIALTWTVISLIRVPGGTAAGVISSSSPFADIAELEAAVAASEAAARHAGPARDVAELPEPGDAADADGWDDPAGRTSIAVFAPFTEQLADAFGRARDQARILYGFATHEMATSWLGTSTGVRRRWTQPTGSVELNAKTADLARSSWGGRAAATPAEFAALDLTALDAELVTRLDWGRRRIELPAGRYRTILPPSAVADLMIHMC